MTATESLRTTPVHLKNLENFLTLDSTGKLFNQAITELALNNIPQAAAQSNHGTIFLAGYAAGLARLRKFVDELSPEYVAEFNKRQDAERKLMEAKRLGMGKPYERPAFPVISPQEPK